jgi:hypothetical protein
MAFEYAHLDDQPVRYTAYQGWIFSGGLWREIHPAEIYHKGRVLDAATFNRLFPDLPKLPEIAMVIEALPEIATAQPEVAAFIASVLEEKYKKGPAAPPAPEGARQTQKACR